MSLPDSPTPLLVNFMAKLPTVRPSDWAEACPCSSGLTYGLCCARGSRRARTATAPPPSGYANPNCYAKSLSDCSAEMSKEHPVSAAVMRRITVDGHVTLKNFAWLKPGETKKLPPQVLAPEVLCVRHNGSLSELDLVGEALFKRFEQMTRAGLGGRVEPSRALFSGFDVERWLLKVTAGHVAGGWSTKDVRSVPDSWATVVWGDERLVAPNGLYFVSLGDRTFHHGIRHMVIFSRDVPIGCYAEMLGMTFYLHVGGRDVSLPFPEGSVAYRPSIIEPVCPGLRLLTEFDFGASGRTGVTVRIAGSLNEAAERIPDAWRRKGDG